MNGERLLERLEDRGWSQAELARRVGVSPQSIGKLARGESQGSKHLHRIAALLLTTPEYLLGETDEPGLEAVATVRHRERLSRAVETEQVVDVPMIDLAYGMGGTYLDDGADDYLQRPDADRPERQHAAYRGSDLGLQLRRSGHDQAATTAAGWIDRNPV